MRQAKGQTSVRAPTGHSAGGMRQYIPMGGTKVPARRPAGEQTVVARQPAHAPPRADPAAPAVALSDRMMGEALPAFQRAVDAVDATAVAQAGEEIALVWSAMQGAQAAVVSADQAQPYEFTLIRESVMRGVTLQTYHGQPVVQVTRTIDTLGDVGHFILEQTESAAATVGDAAELVAVLQSDPEPVHASSDADEKKILGILAAHPNPWQLGYLRAVVEAYGLKDALENLSIDGRRDLQTVFASQEVILKKETMSAADTVGLLEAVTGERKVRVARPAPLGQLATELYGDLSFMDTLLVPYNRFTLKDLPADGLVPAGVELVVEPRLVVERYRPLFKALELARPMMGRPYLTASPDGTAVEGAKIRYTLRWPEPQMTDDLAEDMLTVPLHDVISYCGVGFTAEFDPGAERKATHDEASFEPQVASMSLLAKEGIHVNQKWPVVGNHVLRVTVTPQPDTPTVHDVIGGESVELTYTQTVLRLGEKTEADWLAMEDEAKPVQPGDEELQKWADEQGVSLEEYKRQNPFIFASRTPGYTPEQLLQGLKKQLDVTPAGKDKDKLQLQIDSLEHAQERTKSAPLRPIEALYVSDDSGGSTRLLLYVAPDMQAPNSHIHPLRIWDFTLPDEAREYTDDGSAVDPWESLRIALRTFAHDAPYPDGNLRIRIDSQSLSEDFADHKIIAPEILNLRTQGGSWSERWAGRLVMAGMLIVGTIGGQPEVLLVLTVYGAVTGFADIVERLESGDFEFDLQTAMDLLSIAGALAAGISPFVTTVRGMGEMMLLGKTIGRLQIGVMVGMHSKSLIAAIGSGNWDKIYGALVNAAFDGALVAVTVKAGSHPAGRAAQDPVPGAEPPAPGEPGPAPAPEPTPGEPVPEPGGEPGTGPGVNTARGSARKPPTPPPGMTEPTVPRAGTPAAAHDQWANEVSQTGLAPRAAPAAPTGPVINKPGVYTTAAGENQFSTPEAAFRAFDEALARAGNREVGVFRFRGKGPPRYVVKVGEPGSVSMYDDGNWETALHSHPNPDNVLTVRMPSPKDVSISTELAFQSRRAVTQFIDYPLPDGRRALASYTVEPVRGRVTLKYQRANGENVTREFASTQDYAHEYNERTTYVERGSPAWKSMMQDLDEYYKGESGGDEATARGAAPPPKDRPPRPGPAPGEPAQPASSPRPGQKGPPGPAGGGAAPPGAVPKPKPGEPHRGAGTPMTVTEIREFMVKALRRAVPVHGSNVWMEVDPAEFERQWIASGGTGPAPGGGFAWNGEIWVRQGANITLVVFHEAVHQLADTNGAPDLFRTKFGTFMEEGITERITRTHLGPWSTTHAYDAHVDFQVEMLSHLGVTEDQITRAYLDGEVSELEEAIKRGFNGDAAVTAWFIDSLAKVDYRVSNPAALHEATTMMYTKQIP